MDHLNNFTEHNSVEADTNNDAGTQKEILLSEMVSNLMDALENIQQLYIVSGKRVQHHERLTQDYLHALELQDTSYHECARVAIALQECRRQRRIDKDALCLTEPIANYLTSKGGEKLLGQLECLRNLARNIERPSPNRQYHPRVLSPEEYKNVAKKKPRSKRVTQKTTE